MGGRQAGEGFRLVDADRVQRMLDAFLDGPPAALGQLRCDRPGIYGLFYTGTLDVYAQLDRRLPIYVGVASTSLSARVAVHLRSIDAADNLHAEEFTVRTLVLPSAAEAQAAETFALEALRPLWNAPVLSGLGNNLPGAGRRRQRRSRWDVLHPGRPGRDGEPALDRLDLERQVRAHIVTTR